MKVNSDIAEGCSEFDLERALKGDPVVHSKGRIIKKIGYHDYPIKVEFENGDYEFFSKEGNDNIYPCYVRNFLLMDPKTKKFFVDVFVDKAGKFIYGNPTENENSSLRIQNVDTTYLKTIEIDVPEKFVEKSQFKYSTKKFWIYTFISPYLLMCCSSRWYGSIEEAEKGWKEFSERQSSKGYNLTGIVEVYVPFTYFEK